MAARVGTAATANASGSASSISSSAKSTTTGNLLVAVVKWETGTPTCTSLQDTAGNTWSIIYQNSYASAGAGCCLAYAANITGNASNVVQANFSTGASYRCIVVDEFSGLATTSVLDGSYQTGTGTATAYTTANIVTNVSGMVYMGVGDYGPLSSPTGTDGNPDFTASSVADSAVGFFLISASAQTVTPGGNATGRTSWRTIAQAFKDLTGTEVNLTGQALTGAAGSITALMGASGQAARAVTPDISNTGNWKRSSDAATTNLYAMVDETPPDDADFIYVNTQSAVCEMTLGTVTDPALSTGHRLRYRARSNNSASVKFSLYQGASLIAEWTESLTPVFANFERTLSNAEADAITNYADLRLRLTSV